MPRRKLHNRFAESLGIDRDLADQVNRQMDEPSKWLGPNHRVARHDIPYALRMAFEIPQQRSIKLKGIQRGKEVTAFDVMRAERKQQKMMNQIMTMMMMKMMGEQQRGS